MISLTERVVRAALVALCLTLVAVGVVTAAVLQSRAAAALDHTMLAAVLAEAHPWQTQRFENDSVTSPVVVRPWTDGDPLASPRMVETALALEQPVYVTLGDRRVLALALEPVGTPDEPEDDENHPHFVLVAEAAAVTLADAALPFLGVYAVVAGLALVAAGLGIRAAMHQALEPLHQAARDLAAVPGLGSQARLARGGPVEVDRLLATTNELLDRLEVAFDSQATFTAHAAHELRTPVTVLKGELELALRPHRTAVEREAALHRMRPEVEHLSQVVEGLMALTRVAAGQADRGRMRERVSDAVHRAVQRERATLDTAGCDVSIELGSDAEVEMHPALVATAIGNLLRNAAVHASGRRVAVSVVREGRSVNVVVDDGGPGLSPADRERVLERFQRVSTKRDGLGLGLPLAREIARRHGGDLTLEGSPLGGLRARLWLPEAA